MALAHLISKRQVQLEHIPMLFVLISLEMERLREQTNTQKEILEYVMRSVKDVKVIVSAAVMFAVIIVVHVLEM